MWSCTKFATTNGYDGVQLPCTTYNANKDLIQPFASSGTAELLVEAGSLPGLPAYYEFTLGVRALGATLYTYSSAVQYAVVSKPLLAMINVSSVPASSARQRQQRSPALARASSARQRRPRTPPTPARRR